MANGGGTFQPPCGPGLTGGMAAPPQLTHVNAHLSRRALGSNCALTMRSSHSIGSVARRVLLQILAHGTCQGELRLLDHVQAATLVLGLRAGRDGYSAKLYDHGFNAVGMDWQHNKHEQVCPSWPLILQANGAKIQ